MNAGNGGQNCSACGLFSTSDVGNNGKKGMKANWNWNLQGRCEKTTNKAGWKCKLEDKNARITGHDEYN